MLVSLVKREIAQKPFCPWISWVDPGVKCEGSCIARIRPLLRSWCLVTEREVVKYISMIATRWCCITELKSNFNLVKQYSSSYFHLANKILTKYLLKNIWLHSRFKNCKFPIKVLTETVCWIHSFCRDVLISLIYLTDSIIQTRNRLGEGGANVLTVNTHELERFEIKLMTSHLMEKEHFCCLLNLV